MEGSAPLHGVGTVNARVRTEIPAACPARGTGRPRADGSRGSTEAGWAFTSGPLRGYPRLSRGVAAETHFQAPGRESRPLEMWGFGLLSCSLLAFPVCTETLLQEYRTAELGKQTLQPGDIGMPKSDTEAQVCTQPGVPSCPSLWVGATASCRLATGQIQSLLKCAS